MARLFRESKVPGRVAEAIALHERTLADRERVLGPDHPNTLQSRDNLATAYQEVERATGALPHVPAVGDAPQVIALISPVWSPARRDQEGPYAPSPAVSDCSPELSGTVPEDAVAWSKPGPFDNHDF